jgi:hypothetical protein
MAKGTERLTGINSKYIEDVINGRNTLIFQKQLKYIKDGLIEFQNEIRKAKVFTFLSKKRFKVPKSM